MPMLGWLSLLHCPLLLTVGGLLGWPSSRRPGEGGLGFESGACAWLQKQSLHLLLPVLDQRRKAGLLTLLFGCRLAMLGVTDHLVHERLSTDQYSHWGILLEQKVGRAA